jgi:hypothetical protein
MAVTNFSPLLGLALPTTGDLSGTWGTVVNTAITDLIDSAIAGTTTLSANTNVTLSTTNGATNQAREAILLCTGARTGLTTITAPAQSKTYIVINATTGGQSVKIVGSGPTTPGVTVPNGERALVAWNGSDFVQIASSVIDLTSEITGILPTANGGTGTSSTTFVNLATNVTGTLPVLNGGTGTGTPNLIAGSGVSVSGVWPNQTISATGSGGTITSVTASLPISSSGGTTPNLSFLAPGASGNVLTSDGTNWASSPASGGGISAGKSISFAMIFGF